MRRQRKKRESDQRGISRGDNTDVNLPEAAKGQNEDIAKQVNLSNMDTSSSDRQEQRHGGQNENSYVYLHPTYRNENTDVYSQPDGQNENTDVYLQPDGQNENTDVYLQPDGQNENTDVYLQPDVQMNEYENLNIYTN